MKVYLAARYADASLMRLWRTELEAAGHTVTSRWINGGQRRRFAEEDLEDLRAASVVILHNPRAVHRTGRGGRHVELGIALSDGIPVILVGERDNVFHWCMGVTPVCDFTSALELLVRAYA